MAILNVMLLVSGIGFENVRGKSATLVDFNADKVRLLEISDRRAVVPTMPPESTLKPVMVEPKPTVAHDDTRCLLWSSFDSSSLTKIEARMKQLGISEGHYDIQLSKRLGWWVYLPPFTDVESMQAAMEEAKHKGVSDIAQVRGGEFVNAVSLGAFPTLEKARVHAKKMLGFGLSGVALGPRPNVGDATLTISGDVPVASLTGLKDGWGQGHLPVNCPER
jgi:hypothetical protein